MKRSAGSKWALEIGALLVALGIGGFLVAASGVIPVKASSGHWAITEWFLQFGKKRSVDTHTLTMSQPKLDEPWLVLKGAGHFETGCRPCHGAPDLQRPRIAQAMTPVPPPLSERVKVWTPEELFYIVKHGLKLTGMPAWPALHRDDEVRAMLAFLLELPKLDAHGYRHLVHGPAAEKESVAPLPDLVDAEEPPDEIASNCARCHGVDGLGRGNAAFPALAGQRARYLSSALEAYARGERHSGIMEPIAAALDAPRWRVLATYYAGLPSTTGDESTEASRASVERGEEIARRGIPERGVPSCSDCHGPSAEPKNPAYPRLTGQYADYLVLQLELFKANRRGGSPYAHLMQHVASRLEPTEMRDVAAYYATAASHSHRASR